MPSILLPAGHVLAVALAIGTPLLAFVGGYPLAYVLMLVSLLLIGCWLSSRPALAELPEPAGLMMFAASLLIGVALAFSEDIAHVFNFTMLALFPLLRAALARLAVPGAITLVARGSVAGTVIAAAVALYQIYGLRFPRAEGYGSDAIWAAQAAIIVGFLPLVGLAREPGLWRLPYLLSPVVAIFVVMLCGSRGPLLATVPLILVALGLSRERLALSAGLAITIAIGTLAAWLVVPETFERPLTVIAGLQDSGSGALIDHSLETRSQLYAAGIEAFLQSPLVGHGWNGRVAAAYAQIPGGEAAVTATDSAMIGNQHLHSDILDLGVGAGLFGIIAYILILAAPIAGALRSPRDSQREGRILGTALLCTGMLACGLSYIMLGYEFPTTLYVVLAAVLLGLCRDEPSRPRRRAAFSDAGVDPACRPGRPHRSP